MGQIGIPAAKPDFPEFLAARRREAGRMVQVSSHTWAELVAMFEEADAQAVAAWSAHDRSSPVASDDDDLQLEQRYEALRSIARRYEDALLGVLPPTIEAAAYQLRLLGLNQHATDFAQPGGSEDWEKAILRRIYQALTRLGAAHD